MGARGTSWADNRAFIARPRAAGVLATLAAVNADAGAAKEKLGTVIGIDLGTASAPHLCAALEHPKAAWQQARTLWANNL